MGLLHPSWSGLDIYPTIFFPYLTDSFWHGLGIGSPISFLILLNHCLMKINQVREGRKQTLSECLKREFRLTINILRRIISDDMYEVSPKWIMWLLSLLSWYIYVSTESYCSQGIRALTIDKDNAPKVVFLFPPHSRSLFVWVWLWTLFCVKSNGNLQRTWKNKTTININ